MSTKYSLLYRPEDDLHIYVETTNDTVHIDKGGVDFAVLSKEEYREVADNWRPKDIKFIDAARAELEALKALLKRVVDEKIVRGNAFRYYSIEADLIEDIQAALREAVKVEYDKDGQDADQGT